MTKQDLMRLSLKHQSDIEAFALQYCQQHGFYKELTLETLTEEVRQFFRFVEGQNIAEVSLNYWAQILQLDEHQCFANDFKEWRKIPAERRTSQMALNAVWALDKKAKELTR